MSVTVSLDADGLAEALKSKVKPGVSGNVEILHTKIDERTLWHRPGPPPKPGIYTELRKDSITWMSDHANEVKEQLDFLNALNRAPHNTPILILGLGLGVVLDAALRMEHKGPIDVVEIDAHVLALVQPQFEEWARLADAEVRFHCANAYEWSGARTGRWGLVWADIDPAIVETNLPGNERLEALYGPRTIWMGVWGKAQAEYLRAHRLSGAPPIPGIPVAGIP